MAPVSIYRDASIVTARPVVPGPVNEPEPPYALAGGSQLNVVAEGGPYAANEGQLSSGSALNKSRSGAPWPGILDGAIKFFNSFRRNGYREIANHNVAGNYGAMTSFSNFGFRGFEFANAQAGYPGTQRYAWRPEWNNLIPVIFGLRVINPVAGGGANYTTPSQSKVSQFTEPTVFTPAGTASLSFKGETLQ